MGNSHFLPVTTKAGLLATVIGLYPVALNDAELPSFYANAGCIYNTGHINLSVCPLSDLSFHTGPP